MYAPKFAAGSGASTYARMGLDTSAMSASPHQLITMLFDGAKAAITMARHHMAAQDTRAKGNAISQAINIVENGLKVSLDAEAGGQAGAELVANLSAFYGYITQRLLYANLRNDPALLDEADRLLDSISSAWREIDPHRPLQVPDASEVPAAARLSVGA
jgi:flagellar secretion chaperone FliS